MIKQGQRRKQPKARRRWQAVFALLFVLTVLISAAPELSAQALYRISDSITAVVSSGTDRVDASRIVMAGVDAGEADMVFAGGRKVTIRQNGAELYATTRIGEPVSALLDREGISIGALEMVYVEEAGEEIVIEIASDFTYYETAAEAAAFTTVYTTDYTIPAGETVVEREGVNGVREVTYEVVYADGEEVSRQAVAKGESNAVEQIVRVGTLVKEAQPGDTIASVVNLGDGSGYLLLASGQSLHFRDTMQVQCTAYSSEERTVGTITATGTTVEVGIVAVDKKVIPLGTKMFVTTLDGSYTYGMGRAEDTGVRGKVVDLYMNTIYECKQFGRRNSIVYFLDE